MKGDRTTGHRRAAAAAGDGREGSGDAPAAVLDARVAARGPRHDAPRFASSDAGAAPCAYAVARGGPTRGRVVRPAHRGPAGRIG